MKNWRDNLVISCSMRGGSGSSIFFGLNALYIFKDIFLTIVDFDISEIRKKQENNRNPMEAPKEMM